MNESLLASGVDPTEERELSIDEAAAIIDVSPQFMVKEMEANQIPFRGVGRDRMILHADLMRYRQQSLQRSREA